MTHLRDVLAKGPCQITGKIDFLKLAGNRCVVRKFPTRNPSFSLPPLPGNFVQTKGDISDCSPKMAPIRYRSSNREEKEFWRESVADFFINCFAKHGWPLSVLLRRFIDLATSDGGKRVWFPLLGTGASDEPLQWYRTLFLRSMPTSVKAQPSIMATGRSAPSVKESTARPSKSSNGMTLLSLSGFQIFRFRLPNFAAIGVAYRRSVKVANRFNLALPVENGSDEKRGIA